jgi:glycerophosphoryl diester phosphodiesterase
MNTYNKKYLIGHRGITSIHSENTLESICYIKKFKNLNNLPFNFGSEFDVMLTKDDKIVCHHDNNLKRMTNIDIDVCNINYDELKNIKIKNKYKIPLLKNILDSFKNLNFLLDIEIKDNFKNDKLNIFINKFSNLICKYDYKNFVIKSFNHNIINKLKLLVPDLKIGYLIEYFDESFLNYKNSIIFFDVCLFDEKYCKKKNIICINKYIKNLQKKNDLGCYTFLSNTNIQNENLIFDSIIKYNIKYIVTDNIFHTIFKFNNIHIKL